MIHISGEKLNAIMHLGEFRASHPVASGSGVLPWNHKKSILGTLT